MPGNASPGHRTWHLTPCCRADRVRRKSSQIDLDPIMTSAPDRPPAILGRLSLPWPLTSRDHGMCTHKHMYMHTRMNMCACTRRTPGTTSKNTYQTHPLPLQTGKSPRNIFWGGGVKGGVGPNWEDDEGTWIGTDGLTSSQYTHLAANGQGPFTTIRGGHRVPYPK